MISTWPLVGRTALVARIDAAIADPADRGLILAGPAGVGKSRLVLDALATASAQGLPSALVRVTAAGSSVPLGALSALLPRRDHDDGQDRVGLAFDHLSHLGGDRRLVLAVDDAHLLDPPSAAVVHHLVTAGAVVLLATMRTVAAMPDQAMPDAVTALWKDGLVDRAEVGPLTRDETDALLAAHLGGPVEAGTRRDLWETSQGNVLFLRELVLGAEAAGTLRHEHGLWHLTGDAVGDGGTPRLAELVRARLVSVPPSDRAALELLALAAPVELAVAVAVVGTDAIAALERAGLVHVEGPPRREHVRLDHPLHGEILRAGLPVAVRHATYTRLADAVEGFGSSADDVIRIVEWRLEAGAPVDPALVLEAARMANMAFAAPEAERLARAAWEAGGTFAAGQLLSETLALQGRLADAAAALDAVDAAASSDEDRVLMASGRGEWLLRGLGEADDARRAFEQARTLVTAPPWLDELDGFRAQLELMVLGPAAALELFEPLLAGRSGRAFAAAAQAAGPALAQLGRITESLDVATAGLDARIEAEGPPLVPPGTFVVAQVLALTEAGRLTEAVHLARAGYDETVRQRLPGAQAWLALVLGRALVPTGGLEEAAALAREATVLFEQTGFARLRHWGLGLLVQALVMGGQSEAAALAAGDLKALPPTPIGFMGPDVRRGPAWVAAAQGYGSVARALLVEAAADAEATGQLAQAVACLHDLVRLRLATEWTVRRLGKVGRAVEGPLTTARVAHARAALSGDGDALDAVVDAFADLGADLLAGEAAAAASLAHAAAGHPRRAAAAAARATVLLPTTGGARSPASAAPLERSDLTERELDVARRASLGERNVDIAAALHLSVRTVENYLQRAYLKLGVHHRAELARALDLTPS